MSSFRRDIGDRKKTLIEISRWKRMSEMKNTMNGINSRLDTWEEENNENSMEIIPLQH